MIKRGRMGSGEVGKLEYTPAGAVFQIFTVFFLAKVDETPVTMHGFSETTDILICGCQLEPAIVICKSQQLP